jgi:hypothetical protein
VPFRGSGLLFIICSFSHADFQTIKYSTPPTHILARTELSTHSLFPERTAQRRLSCMVNIAFWCVPVQLSLLRDSDSSFPQIPPACFVAVLSGETLRTSPLRMLGLSGIFFFKFGTQIPHSGPARMSAFARWDTPRGCFLKSLFLCRSMHHICVLCPCIHLYVQFKIFRPRLSHSRNAVDLNY